MSRTFSGVSFILVSVCAAFAQAPAASPAFEIADVHVSPKSTLQFARNSPVRGGRYEVKNASMLDLIRFAYGFNPDTILGGPSWLDMDRFDVIARAPADSTQETQRLMLQTLLEDRFRLVVRKETRPIPSYALTVGKKPSMKEADGSGDTGCRLKSAEGSGENGRLGTFENGVQTMINLGPGATIQYQCRNMTMAAFAGRLQRMMGASLGVNPVLDQTGLKGSWNFDVPGHPL
jgi:uncharacterized protein (TIGR03435 family)